MADQLLEIGEDLCPLGRPVVELGQIAPYGFAGRIGGVDRIGRNNRPAAVTGKPVRMADNEFAVPGGMIDHEIHNHAQSVRARHR